MEKKKLIGRHSAIISVLVKAGAHNLKRDTRRGHASKEEDPKESGEIFGVAAEAVVNVVVMILLPYR